MKVLFIIGIALTVACNAMARERSEADMIQAAAQVLEPVAGTRATGMAMPVVLHAGAAYTIVGYEAGGFAVVANDDRVEAVLGYVPQAEYNSVAMPEGLRWWLRGVERALEGTPRYARSSTYRYNKTGVASVAPMLETQWGQGEPYNLQCPIKLYSSTGHMATGCIATAMAQIMRYWRYPVTGDGEAMFNLYYYLYADYAGTHYRWSDMLPRYGNAGYTDAQGDAVAELMMHCGVSVNMRYADNESGAKGQYVAGALRDHFRYNKNVSFRNRMMHSEAEWMGSVYSELAAGRPILYTGQDSRMSYGHAFVFDGYNDEGMVHVNWGWDGNYDGYFDINLLNSGYMRLSFTDEQTMTVGIGMPEDDIVHTVEVGLLSDLELHSGVLLYPMTITDKNTYILRCGTIANLSEYDLGEVKGKISLVMPARRGIRELTKVFPIKESDGTEDNSFGSFYTKEFAKEYEVKLSEVQSLSDGTYYMYLAYCDEYSNSWQPLWAADNIASYFQVKKKGSDFTVEYLTGQYITPVDGIDASAAPCRDGVYNLHGQKVNPDYRGVVIHNGKKTLKR